MLNKENVVVEQQVRSASWRGNSPLGRLIGSASAADRSEEHALVGLPYTSSAIAELKERKNQDPAAFQAMWEADVKSVKKKMSSVMRGALDPRSVKMQYWDLLTGMALLFTMLWTPIEVGLRNSEINYDALFVVNWVVNSVFIADVGVQFFLPYPVPGGGFERRLRKIWRNYLRVRSWGSSSDTASLP